MANIIEVIAAPFPTGFHVRFKGEHAAEIVKLFGTDVIPTPFGKDADVNRVYMAVKEMNPDCQVILVGNPYYATLSLTAKDRFKEVMDALQNAEEMGGVMDNIDYQSLMAALEHEINQRYNASLVLGGVGCGG